MKALEYIDAIKAKYGVTSDYAVAKLLGASTQKVSNWRKRGELPGPLMCFKIAELLGDQPSAVIADIELERAEKGERDADAEAWRGLIGKIGGGGMAAGLLVAVLAGAPLPSDARTMAADRDFSLPVCVLC